MKVHIRSDATEKQSSHKKMTYLDALINVVRIGLIKQIRGSWLKARRISTNQFSVKGPYGYITIPASMIDNVKN